jgi:hypothetical protein
MSELRTAALAEIDRRIKECERLMSQVQISGTQTQTKERPLCGAKCRDGHLCAARVVARENGTLARRCKLHGGLSTRPRAYLSAP